MMLLRSAADCTTSITSESMAAMHITGRLRTKDDHGCCDVCRTQACAFVGSGRRHHCFLLRARPHDRLLSAAACQDRRRLLHGRTGNDGVDCRSKLPFCQSGSARADGVAASAYQYGILATHWYWIGAIPAMLFLGIVMMPFYYISKTHSVPGYLRLR